MRFNLSLARFTHSAPAIVVLGMAVLLTACAKDVASPEPRQTVSVYEVGQIVVKRERKFYGRVVPADMTRVAFRIPGKIVHLSVQPGQRVVAGQVLARIEGSIARQVLMDAQAQYALSKRQLERADNLHRRGALTLAQLNQLQAGFRLAEANLKLAEANFSYTVIEAPFDGTIADVIKELYESVKGGETIATIYRNNRTDVLVDLPDSLPSQVHEESDVNIIQVQAVFAGSEEVHMMNTLKVSTARNPKTQSFEYWLTMPAPEVPYPPGSMVTVAADLEDAGFRTEAGILVPLSALQADSRDGVFRIWQVSDEVVTPVPVQVDGITEAGAIIQTSIKEGDLIAVSGLARLTAGKKVSIQRQDQGL